MMKEMEQLEKDLQLLGLLDKARELYTEFGEAATLSYLRSSYRLLSKVYHPDMNPRNSEKAEKIQQRLNRVNDLLGRLDDRQVIDLVRKKISSQSPSGKKKILVVEDEFGLQEVLRDIFLMEGYDVRVAVDGDEGYDAYLRFKPDLVFTDVVMPKMSGLELVRKIREVDPKVRVIYVSGFFGIKGVKRELEEDIAQYGSPTLAKPFKISNMLELVGEVLQ
jgi:CheY-like chemotaxis protein